MLFFAAGSVFMCQYSASAEGTNQLTPNHVFEQYMFITSAYREKALQILIDEANRLARDLDLPENMPIREANLVEISIPPPRIAREISSIGMVATSNYIYVAHSAKGPIGEFRLTRTHLESEYEALSQYKWRWSQLDTNAAYKMAAQWMNAASMDLVGLNRDCQVFIEPWTPGGKGTNYFVPLYRVKWKIKTSKNSVGDFDSFNGWRTVALVELFLPSGTLRQLYVKDSKYILRNLVCVTNEDYLLSQTNDQFDASKTKLMAKQRFDTIMATNLPLKKSVR